MQPKPEHSILFDSLVAREERRGLFVVAFLRIVMLAFILLLFSKPDLPTGELYSLLEVLGWFIPGVFIQIFVAWYGRNWRWMLYILAIVDAALIVYVSVVPDPLNPLTQHPAWVYGFVAQDRGVVFSMIMMALVIMTFSPRLILWFGSWLVIAWGVGIGWLIERPGVLIPKHFGDEWNPDQDELIATYMRPEFLDVSSLIEQVILVVVFTLACAVMVSRLRLLIKQFAAAERAHGNLARYFPAALADQLADRDEPVRIGERRDCVILFADIIGFSGYAENRDPQDVMRLLNSFHGIMTTQIAAYGGIVEKYIGDAMMASFGAFEDIPAPTANALAAAQAMLDRISEWQEKDGQNRPLRIGVGLHFGPAVVGDVGEGEAVTPAVIGATVNLASRLERATRDLDAEIVLSCSFAGQLAREIPATHALMMASFAGQDDIRVKGFSTPIPVRYQARPHSAASALG
ncbi:adenylate/guanylate cyclase domain-containing protein [Thalassospira sp.]|uniref:adenylate/guanylate cyclase domain-containing protein n=1 Tax=Thalassospira sp. TaxID=1912094 RepID=UPI002733E301|nr:adenylate/guanylate cyclase domain-containing protein [Thalassospira sp.]MDP2700285.1 adenylate/guanylate cyclase domain-containing protein [Thalassospira sp.]